MGRGKASVTPALPKKRASTMVESNCLAFMFTIRHSPGCNETNCSVTHTVAVGIRYTFVAK